MNRTTGLLRLSTRLLTGNAGLTKKSRSVAALWRTSLVAALIGIAACGNAQGSYSASNDFNITNGNPNGVWGYGHSTTLGGPYLPSTLAMTPYPGFESWTANILGTQCPHVTKNVTPSIIPVGTVVIQPLQMLMHPGPNNEYSILRFKPPCAGEFNFAASFVGVDWVGTTTDVHILKNGQVIWSSQVNGYLSSSATSGSVYLSSGDTLDVAVGAGNNGHYYFDTTGVEFDIAQVSHSGPLSFDGFLAPIGGADATGGSFAAPILARNLGSTIPVKFRAATCCDTPVLTGIHTLHATKYSSATSSGSPIAATSSDGPTIGNQFRLTGNQWHFNLNTSALSKGTWKLTATLSDGNQHFVWINLK